MAAANDLLKWSSYLLASVLLLPDSGLAQDSRPSKVPTSRRVAEQIYPSDVLSAEKWRAVDVSIERGLAWLADQQQRDGSFPTFQTGQPGVTGLVVMAFLADGHEPGRGKYGKHLEQAIDYVLRTQREDGLFSSIKPIAPVTNWNQATHTAMYNHAIAGLMLCESYGMASSHSLEEVTAAIEKGLQLTYREQRRPGPYQVEDGGWRYLKYVNQANKGEADLSVTGWHLMFLRSAANAGFDVPEERVKAAAGYVRRCFDKKKGRFLYGILPQDRSISRGMVGAGILSLAMAGEHNTKIARQAGDWLLKHPVNRYNKPSHVPMDRFHYGVHYASHAMYQLGGNHWQEFYPTMVSAMLAGQLRSGAWAPEAKWDNMYGNSYTTALAILSLSPPYQLLPIYQR